MKTLVRIILFSFICISAYSSLAQTGELDGKSFKIHVNQETGKKHKLFGGWPTDTLNFDSGKMSSYYMLKKERFYSSSYSPVPVKSDLQLGINFKYENTNSGGSFLQIEGTAKGTSISGSICWISAYKSRKRTYSFVGNLI